MATWKTVSNAKIELWHCEAKSTFGSATAQKLNAELASRTSSGGGWTVARQVLPAPQRGARRTFDGLLVPPQKRGSQVRQQRSGDLSTPAEAPPRVAPGSSPRA